MPGFRDSGIRHSYQPKVETLQHISKPQTILSSDPHNNSFVGGIMHDDGTVEYMTMKDFKEKLEQSKNSLPKQSYDEFMKYFKDTTKITNIE
jgi:hypothetical protein